MARAEPGDARGPRLTACLCHGHARRLSLAGAVDEVCSIDFEELVQLLQFCAEGLFYKEGGALPRPKQLAEALVPAVWRPITCACQSGTWPCRGD